MTLKRLTLLLLVLSCCGLVSCSTSPGEDPDTKVTPDGSVDPDTMDLLSDAPTDADAMETVEIIQEQAKLKVTPLYILHQYEEVDGVTKPDSQCGMFFNGSGDLDTYVEVYVEASLTPVLKDQDGNDEDGALGIKKLKLWEPDGDKKLGDFELIKEEMEGGGDYYYWKAQVQASKLRDLYIDKSVGEILDGKEYLRVTAEPDESLGTGTDALITAVKVTLDQTWPAMLRKRPPPEITLGNPILVQGFLTIEYDLQEDGEFASGPGRLEVFIGDDLEPAKVIENPPDNVVSVVDMSGYDSGEYMITVVATDCVGNSEDDKFPAINVAEPDFKHPGQLKSPDQVGTLHTLHTIVETEPNADDALAPGSGALSRPDLLAIGTTGLAWAPANEDDEGDTLGALRPLGLKCPEPPVEGEEEEPPPEGEDEVLPEQYVWDGLTVVDAYLDDVTGDGYFDIVALVENGDAKEVVVARKNVTPREDVEDNKPEEGCPIYHNWNGEECVYEYDVCYHLVVALNIANSQGVNIADANQLRLAHLNDDDGDGDIGSKGDRKDILVSSPKYQTALWIFTHTGKFGEEEWPPPEPVEEPPEETPYFQLSAMVSGPSDVSDIAVGNFNGDAYPDVVLGRGDQEGVAVALLKEDATVDTTKHTTLTGGTVLLESGTAEDNEGKFHAAIMDNLVVTATSDKAIYYIKSKVGGYFKNPKFPGAEEHPWGLENVSNMVHHQITNSVLPKPEVTTAHEPTEAGIAMSIGGKPDSMIFTDLSGGGNADIAVAIPELNQIAIFLGTGQDTFADGLFVSPGKAPRSVAAADFNGDDHKDLVCLVDTDLGVQVAVLVNEVAPWTIGPGDVPWVVARFRSPMEIPLPVGYNWTSGRLVPTHFIVDDFDGDKLQDVVVATAPDKQVTPSGGEKSIPLIISFMSEKLADDSIEPYPQIPAIKSVVALEFSQDLAGFAAGNLNGDGHLDLAITATKSADTLCSGRTFDVLIGGWMTDRALDEDDGVEPEPGEEEETMLEGFSADYYEWTPINPGHFTPMGGYLGLQTPTGIEVASLDMGQGALYDDIILLAAENGSPGSEGYQPNMLATYLTLYSDGWGSPDDVLACETQDMVWYDGSPYWPMEQTDFHCAGGGGGEPPGICHPVAGSCDSCSLLGTSAKPSGITIPGEIPSVPVATTVADFFPDPNGCADILVLQSDGLLTYLRGNCDSLIYTFDQELMPTEILNVGFGPVDMDAADLDGDGNFDVVIALSDDVVVLYGLPGGESFENPVGLGVVPEVVPSSITLADVNDDGKEDILVTSTPFNLLAVYINANVKPGDNKFSFNSFPTGKEPIASQVGDVNNDGCLDIAVLNAGAKSVTILESARCEDK